MLIIYEAGYGNAVACSRSQFSIWAIVTLFNPVSLLIGYLVRAAFPSGWQEGDWLVIRIQDGRDDDLVMMEVKLTSSPFDEADPILIHSDRLLPSVFALSQNYPNPFNGITQLRYDLPKTAYVTIKIRNILGQAIRTLLDEEKDSGYHVVEWDGRNEGGESVASGVYFYRLVERNYTETKKMLLLK